MAECISEHKSLFSIIQDGKWVVEYDLETNKYFVSKIIVSICPLCNNKKIIIRRFNKQPINYVLPSATIVVPAKCRESLTGKSYTKILGANYEKTFILASKYKNLYIIRTPKHANLINISSLPPYSIVHSWKNLTIAFTNQPILDISFYQIKIEICFKCIEFEFFYDSVNMEKIEQGHLTLINLKSAANSQNCLSIFEGIQQKVLKLGKPSTTFFNHQLSINNKNITIKTFKNLCTFENNVSANLISPDHNTIQIQPGVWVGYHPNPQED